MYQENLTYAYVEEIEISFWFNQVSCHKHVYLSISKYNQIWISSIVETVITYTP